MSIVWDFYWPALVAAVIIGVVAGTLHFRRSTGTRDYGWLLKGAALAVALGLLWHGPGGAGSRFVTTVESSARKTLVDFEMAPVTARLGRGPVTRTITLSGPANDFQQTELVRIMGAVPGVASARWDRPIEKARAK